MGGKGSGGAHNLVPVNEKRRRMKLKLSQLYDPALQTINRAVVDGAIAPSMWVIEMVDGKPKQKQEITGEGGGPLVIEIRRVPDREEKAD